MRNEKGEMRNAEEMLPAERGECNSIHTWCIKFPDAFCCHKSTFWSIQLLNILETYHIAIEIHNNSTNL